MQYIMFVRDKKKIFVKIQGPVCKFELLKDRVLLGVLGVASKIVCREPKRISKESFILCVLCLTGVMF